MLRGHIFLVHGRDLLGIENLHFYQNTFITQVWSGSYAGRTWVNTNAQTKRRVFNNLFVYLDRYPDIANPEENDILMDGNLHWCPLPDAKLPEGFLDKVRQAKGSKSMQAKHGQGWEMNSIVADPRFVAFSARTDAANDYRLQKNSPALRKGVALPKELEDPHRPKDGTRPDIGALPQSASMPAFGRP
jgi:hypothetical protein